MPEKLKRAVGTVLYYFIPFLYVGIRRDGSLKIKLLKLPKIIGY